ncbi:MAG: TetR family transcriptional regulator [Desulfobacterales bacterium CG23_combo_of_CG06-09_8_20_14_all_51_8]|nr:MAG: TetR family transcriptional regulator [Desulfobacterales bacterium CG23_combo_of_CG06-09_8_20_14_all_51_8]
MTAVRTPKQPRSIQTKKRIMRAAFHLYAHKGIHGTNSREIAQKAGVSIGSFYSYFKNKKTLLLEMLEDYLNRHFLAIWKPIEKITINNMGRADIRWLIESVFAAYGISPEFHSQTHALRYSDPDINQVYERERTREVTQIQSLLESNRHRMRISDPEAAAIVIHNAVENVAHTAKFIGPKTDEKALIDALADMIYDFLIFGRQPE